MRFALGVLLSTVVFFVWSAISWMALPWQRGLFKQFQDEDAMAQLLDTQAPGSGIYGLPAEPSYYAVVLSFLLTHYAHDHFLFAFGSGFKPK